MNLVEILKENGEPGPLTELERTFPKIARESLFESGGENVLRLDGMVYPKSVIDVMTRASMHDVDRLDLTQRVSDADYQAADTVITDELVPWNLVIRMYVLRAIIRAHVAGGIPYEEMKGFASFRLHALTTPGFDQLELLSRPLKVAHAMCFPGAPAPQLSIIGVVSLMYNSPLMLDARLRVGSGN